MEVSLGYPIGTKYPRYPGIVQHVPGILKESYGILG